MELLTERLELLQMDRFANDADRDLESGGGFTHRDG
jgi:hypothetical protein